MTATLTQPERERLLREDIGLALDNFSLAWRVADLLIEYAAASVPPPQAIVQLIGRDKAADFLLRQLYRWPFSIVVGVWNSSA
jgi:hypothetical protein